MPLNDQIPLNLSARLFARRLCWSSAAGICLLGIASAEPETDADTPAVARQPSASRRGYLGITLTEICPEVRSQTRLRDGEGVMIGRVAPGSPAENFGLAHYDILTKFNDQWLMSPSQFVTLVENAGPGTEVELTFLHRGIEQTGKVRLGNMPESPVSVEPLPEEMLSRVIRILRDNPAILASVHRSLTGQGPAKSTEPESGLSLRHGSRISLRDSAGEVELTLIGNSQRIRSWNLVGALEFEGPVNTPEELASIPDSLRPRVERLLQECRATTLRRPGVPVKELKAPLATQSPADPE